LLSRAASLLLLAENFHPVERALVGGSVANVLRKSFGKRVVARKIGFGAKENVVMLFVV
jgi:hypothetical protein